MTCPRPALRSLGAEASEHDQRSAELAARHALEYLSRQVTLCITTRNRQADLDEHFRSLSSLGLASLPILIVDDGSTVPIRACASADFPNVQLTRYDTSAGLVERRNTLIASARTPFVLSLDDDSELLVAEDLIDVLSEMELHPDWAVVGYSIVDVTRGSVPAVVARAQSLLIVPSQEFVGCGHILRRELFMRLGGYRASLEYIGEERDLSMRAIASGYEIVRVKNRYVAHYRSSTNRSSKRFVEYTARNVPIIWLLNCPYAFRWLWYIRSVMGIVSFIALRGWDAASVFRGIARGRRLYDDASSGPMQRLSYRTLWKWWHR